MPAHLSLLATCRLYYQSSWRLLLQYIIPSLWYRKKDIDVKQFWQVSLWHLSVKSVNICIGTGCRTIFFFSHMLQILSLTRCSCIYVTSHCYHWGRKSPFPWETGKVKENAFYQVNIKYCILGGENTTIDFSGIAPNSSLAHWPQQIRKALTRQWHVDNSTKASHSY